MLHTNPVAARKPRDHQQPGGRARRFANIPAWAWLLALAIMSPFIAAYVSAAAQ